MRVARLPALVAVALGLVTAGCVDGGSGAPAAPPTAPATSEATTTSTTVPVTAGRPYEVERIDRVVEDTSRTTAAAPNRGLAAQPSRTLPLLVLAPKGDGPFPVVVFSHGVTGTGPAYEPLLRDIAAAGYVVIAPTFPLSSGPGGQIFDYVNQPDDVYFALDAVLGQAADPADALHGRVDGERVALAGHSLGAMTTVGAAFNSCCADDRVDAAVMIASVEAPFPGGDYDARPPTPALFVHGDADPTLVVPGGERLFAAATGPAAFLRFPQGAHSDILTGAAGAVLRTAVVAWLDRWLLGEPAGFDALPAALEASGVAGLTVTGVEP